jgi:hypothetical protein
MTDDKDNSPQRPAAGINAGPMNKDEVALELMRFIAVTTGIGRASSGAGFSGGKTPKSTDEQVDALIQLFERCRGVVEKGN